MEPIPNEVNHAALARRWEEVMVIRPPKLQTRIRRSLSWIECAERVAGDDDTAFISYWIAFNAAYAEGKPSEYRRDEKSRLRWYFREIVNLDAEHVITVAIRQRFTDSINAFLNNKWVFQPFWDYEFYGVDKCRNWQRRFDKDRKIVSRKLHGPTDRRKRTGAGKPEGDVVEVLATLFQRLYVLRNQLMHGGATWGGSVNRDQVRDGKQIMTFLIPRFIHLMIENPDDRWGDPPYPPPYPYKGSI